MPTENLSIGGGSYWAGLVVFGTCYTVHTLVQLNSLSLHAVASYTV